MEKLSCGTDDTLPETFEYSDKIVGEWQQVATFNLVETSTNLDSYDWFTVEDGFTLELFEDGIKPSPMWSLPNTLSL